MLSCDSPRSSTAATSGPATRSYGWASATRASAGADELSFVARSSVEPRPQLASSDRMSSLGRSAVLGAIWTTSSSVGSRMIGIVTTFILTRLLPPDVQGEVYNTYIVVASASALTTLGLGAYITAHPTVGRAVV